ncbi:polyketide synthase [Pseudoalteromonas xiamenensis]|uniref:beta-ketoacyl [acyl carrier protein] synthase domain-containing protein n=1 Tax=Pseudoalteromonas xiamenensis TaxID=882626 RepID=UPI0035E4B737
MTEHHDLPLAVIAVGTAFSFDYGIDGLPFDANLPAPQDYPFKAAGEAIKGAPHFAVNFDYKKFSIPPLFRKAVSRETRLALLAADNALKGLALGESLRDFTDQYCAIHLGSDAAYRNATKITAIKRYAEQLREQQLSDEAIKSRIDDFKLELASQFGASSHDRVGEMASSIPSRIAHFAKTRGKCQTIDAADLGGLRLVEIAKDALRHSDSKVAVLTSVQCFHQPAQIDLLHSIGVKTRYWLEGAVTLVVCTLETAKQNDFKIIAELGDVTSQKTSHALAQQAYFSGANQVFCSLLSMFSERKAAVMGQSARGITWQVNAESTADAMSYHQPVYVTDAVPITAQGYQQADFWDTLANGRDTLKPHSKAQLDRTAFFRSSPQKLSTYIENTMGFASHEAMQTVLEKPMMPAKRQRLDVTQLHLLNAVDHLALPSLDTKKVAIIVATNLSLQSDRLLGANALWPSLPNVSVQLPKSNLADIARWSWHGACGVGSAELLAEKLGVEADCYAVEAACASSMAAFHNAIRALQSGRYDVVITGGIECATLERDLVLCGAQMMLSATRIRPFALHADGFTPGDGGGLFIFSKEPMLSEPTCQVMAISGSCDSRSMTAPDPEGQALAMQKTISQRNDITPDAIQYIETHGTGTDLGDKAEAISIAQHYHRTEQEPLVLGSAKYNFGHCFAGAASISLAKVWAAFAAKQLPPTPILGELNTGLALEAIPATVLQQSERWPVHSATQSRHAAINAFGTGGINYHLILTYKEHS